LTDRIVWWNPRIAGPEYALVKEVLDSHYINEGDVTTQFERRIAELLGVRHAVATTSGTAALFLSIAGLGIGHGDEVIVPDATFIATANAVKLAGATPVLVDIEPATLNISPQAIEQAITPRTKAIIPVHVSGRAADMRRIMAIARGRNLYVIEDAAEALMSAVDGRYLGTFGQAGCFSFSPNKTITTGQGGMVVTNDDALHLRLRQLKDQGRPVRGTGGDDVHPSIGYNFKLTNLQAAIGLGQLEVMNTRLERQRRIHEIYLEMLSGVSGITLPGFRLKGGETPLWTDAVIDRRNELDTYLQKKGISCRRFWFPIHTQPPYREPDERFPNSTRLLPRAIWLPSAYTMTDDDVRRVCREIRAFFGAS
jgi:perosamine synthetase